MLQTSIGLCCYCFYHLLAILEYSFNSFCGTLFSFFSVSFLFSLCSFYHNVPESRARAHNFAVSLLLKSLRPHRNTQSMRYFFILYFVSLFFFIFLVTGKINVYIQLSHHHQNQHHYHHSKKKREKLWPNCTRCIQIHIFSILCGLFFFFYKTAKKKSSRL